MTIDPRKLEQSRHFPQASAPDEGAPADLNREAANMLELLARQSDCSTPLSISSKAAQAVLKQF